MKKRIWIQIMICIFAFICCACAKSEPSRSAQAELPLKTESMQASDPSVQFQETALATVEQAKQDETHISAAEPKETQKGKETATKSVEQLQFPYAIANTDLVIQQISDYDGVFLEDGTDDDVVGLTVMLLSNTGSSDVEYASITLQRGSETLQFEVSVLPAGASVAVQEKNRAAYVETPYSACQADVALLDDLGMLETSIRVQETGVYALSVTNLSDEAIPAVRLFYKFYMEEQNAYIGGITYTAKLTDLKPGEEREITPAHYAQGYSRIVMVRTYDTSD